jgi:hypothetical protein
VSYRTAHAEARDADPRRAEVAHHGGGSAEVRLHLVGLQRLHLGHQLAAAAPAGAGEQVGCDGGVALAGEALADAEQLLADAVALVDDDDAGGHRPRRAGEEVRDLAHCW